MKSITEDPCPENQVRATANHISDNERPILQPSSEEPPETNPVALMSMLRMSYHIFTNGWIGAITLMISFGFAASEQILFGYLENSYVFITAKGATIVLANLF